MAKRHSSTVSYQQRILDSGMYGSGESFTTSQAARICGGCADGAHVLKVMERDGLVQRLSEGRWIAYDGRDSLLRKPFRSQRFGWEGEHTPRYF